MKENIENFRESGFLNLDEYLKRNPENFVYPYYLEGYNGDNFWTRIRKEDEEKFVYVKPRELHLENEYNTYAELIQEEVLKQVGIKTAHYDLAKYNNNVATISDNALGDYDKELFLLNSSELLSRSSYISDDTNDIENIFRVIHEYCESEGLGQEIEEKCKKDIANICVANTFLMSTNQTLDDFDFVVGMDKNGEEKMLVSPVCHNSYCLGSNFTKNDIEEMLENSEIMKERIDLCYTDVGISEELRDTSYPYWEDSLYYMIEEDEDVLEFATYCANKINIDDAINKVEERIEADIPKEYKDFVRVSFYERLDKICSSLNLDYYTIMDNKIIDGNMEGEMEIW